MLADVTTSQEQSDALGAETAAPVALFVLPKIQSIDAPEEMKNGKTASKLYTAEIVNAETGYKETYMYVFKFVDDYCIMFDDVLGYENCIFLGVDEDD